MPLGVLESELWYSKLPFYLFVFEMGSAKTSLKLAGSLPLPVFVPPSYTQPLFKADICVTLTGATRLLCAVDQGAPLLLLDLECVAKLSSLLGAVRGPLIPALGRQSLQNELFGSLCDYSFSLSA